MSPLPVRVETNASRLPSGEYIGFDSVAGCDTRIRAWPPLAGTVQISPPDTNAISDPSGEGHGSEKYALGSTAPSHAAPTNESRNIRIVQIYRSIFRPATLFPGRDRERAVYPQLASLMRRSGYSKMAG